MEKRKVLKGNTISEGIALAEICHYQSFSTAIKTGCFPKGEETIYWEVFKIAFERTQNELQQLSEEISTDNQEQKSIFAAHKMLLGDESLFLGIQSRITEARMYPEAAITDCFEKVIQEFSNLQDELIAEREADILDVKRRLLRNYLGVGSSKKTFLKKNVIVVAESLLPSDVIAFDRNCVKGIVTEKGGVNSHAAILARSYQIPFVSGINSVKERLPEGKLLLMNMGADEVILNPSEEEILAAEKKKQAFASGYVREKDLLSQPCIWKNGTKIQIGLNIDEIEFDVPEAYYDYIGLFRTEFLYMKDMFLPDEEEQFLAYKRVLQNAKGKMVTLRTLDLANDKNLYWIGTSKKRGLEFCFAEPEIFLTQIRAVLRASKYGPVSVMFPMVKSLKDFHKAKAFLNEAMKQLDEEGMVYDKNIPIGIMIEMPELVEELDKIATEADFASIGTNDLTKYLCGIDRMEENVSMEQLIKRQDLSEFLQKVFTVFEHANKPVSVCGEMAGNPVTARYLAELGARALSMNAGNIVQVKAELRK